MIGVLFALPALAVIEEPDDRNITVTATIEPIFDVSFAFYNDLDGCDEGEGSLGTPLEGEAPPLVFTVIPNPARPIDPDDPTIFAMVGQETYRVLVGVVNNTGTQYVITQATAALQGPGGSTIDGAFIVNSFIDEGDDRDTTVGTGTGVIVQASSTTQLYISLAGTSQGDHPGTVVQIVYGITDGWGCGGIPNGYTSDDLVGIDQRSGQYDGQLTLTVDWQG
jgi:hypothetical protein